MVISLILVQLHHSRLKSNDLCENWCQCNCHMMFRIQRCAILRARNYFTLITNKNTYLNAFTVSFVFWQKIYGYHIQRNAIKELEFWNYSWKSSVMRHESSWRFQCWLLFLYWGHKLNRPIRNCQDNRKFNIFTNHLIAAATVRGYNLKNWNRGDHEMTGFTEKIKEIFSNSLIIHKITTMKEVSTPGLN